MASILGVLLLGWGFTPHSALANGPKCEVVSTAGIDFDGAEEDVVCERYEEVSVAGSPVVRGKPVACVVAVGMDFCGGLDQSCRYDVWGPPFAYPVGDKPEGAKPWLLICTDEVSVLGGVPPPVVRPVWLTPAQVGARPPSLRVLAAQALAKVRVPSVRVVFGPAKYAVVNADTLWWASGAAGVPVRGSGAFGVVATAVPRGLRISPGDGSAVISCPWVVSQEAARGACVSVFEKSSVDGDALWQGQPAFTAKVSAVWDVTYSQNGKAFVVQGTTGQLTSAETSVIVPVAEIQSIVGPAPR